jgi:hypothetical protein
VESKEADGNVKLLNVIELSFYIFLMELNLRLKFVVVLGEVNHVSRDIIANNLGDDHSVVGEPFSQSECWKSIATADVNNRKGLLALLKLVSDDLNKVIEGLLVKVPLQVISFWVSSVEGLFFSIKLKDSLNSAREEVHVQKGSWGLAFCALVIGCLKKC